MTKRLRILMVGTGDFAIPTFQALSQTEHELVGLVTQPDRPQGRKQELIPSRIKTLALEKGVMVFQPENVNDAESLEVIRQLQPDLMVTAAYGQILSADLLAIPPLGGVNLHGSVLPAYRGAAPVARAIQNGDRESGVTVIQMSPKLDAGGMIAVAKTPIGPNETAGELEDRLALIGAPLIIESIDALIGGTAQIIPQDPAKVTKAPKLRKETSRIDWTKSAQAVHDHVRAMSPWPLADTTFISPTKGPDAEPARLIVHQTLPVDQEHQSQPGAILDNNPKNFLVACGMDAVRIVTVQIIGKKAMPIADFLRGHQLLKGQSLGL